MKKIIVSSLRSNAGKTSVMAGIISSMKDTKFAYAKPLGDRLIYRRKRSWDYDANLMVHLLGKESEMDTHFEKITLGFDHSRLKYMYDEEGVQKALAGIVKDVGDQNDVLFIESGQDLAYGAYLNLDALSIARYIDGQLLIVVSGNCDSSLDDIRFMNKYIGLKNDKNFCGIIVNKIDDLDQFDDYCTPAIRDMGIPIVGVLPYKEQLTRFTVDFLAEKTLARVLAAEDNLNNVVRNIVIGTPSTDSPYRHPLSAKPGLHEGDELMIISGDRNDMILAALDRDTAGIILTNDIVPHHNVIARANERGIPILLVEMDTFKTAKTIDDMEVLLRKEDTEKIRLLSSLIEKHSNIKEFLK